jgi:hypothetical protein
VDKTLIVSSANISHNSKEVLDEAGIITTDSATVRRACELFDKLCTEPIGKEYLKTCIAEYRPPKFKAAGEHRPSRSKRSRRIVEAKLWFVGGLKALSLSDVDRKSVEQVERHHQTKLSRPEQTELTWIRYHRLPKALRQVRVGDWIVDCQKDGRGRYVGAPKQMLGFDKWVSDRGTRYTLMMLEVASAGEVMSLTDFRRKAVAIQPELNHPNPRSRPIVEKKTGQTTSCGCGLRPGKSRGDVKNDTGTCGYLARTSGRVASPGAAQRSIALGVEIGPAISKSRIPDLQYAEVKSCPRFELTAVADTDDAHGRTAICGASR